MKKPYRREHKQQFPRPGILPVLGLFIVAAAAFLLSGCSIKDVVDPVTDFFARDASTEEETASVLTEDMLLYAQVNNADGQALVRSDGEPLTVLVAYETATGGEPRINPQGVLETHPVGEVVTYAPGTPVLLPDGSVKTYEGGEKITDLLGFAIKDENGNPLTHAAGEEMTHGVDEIVLDEQGERMTYNGEPYTYAPGEQKYETNGEPATYAVTVLKDRNGENMTRENGDIVLSEIELMTDASGNPLISEQGEAETKQLNPQPPEQIYEPPFEENTYYINSITSDYVFFSTPEVQAQDINIVAPDADESARIQEENGEGPVNNLQLEILGSELKGIEVRFDAEGYAYFVIPETGKVLGLIQDAHNGANVLPVEMEKISYPQYKFWEDPLGTVSRNQRWIIEKNGEDAFLIRSAANDSYVMTVDDTYGTQYANIMLWEENGSDTQKFRFSSDVPKVQQHLEAGDYYIRTSLSDWMLLSIGDGNYEDNTNIYIYTSDQGDGQMFRIEYDEYGFAVIYHNDSSKALTVRNDEAKDGQEICQYEYDGGDWQRWIIDPAEEGFYIRSALNVSEVMDLRDAEARNQKPILLHWNNDSQAQYWYFSQEAIPAPTSYETMDQYAQEFSSSTEYLIMVDNTTNHVGVYQGQKGNWNNIYYWDCVTGKASTPSLKGEYSIYSKSPSFDGNMDSPAWYTCYYASWWYPAYAFHSIIYYQGTWDIMDGSMGYNGSHGCVRLYTDNAQWIYDNIPLNTKVVSY